MLLLIPDHIQNNFFLKPYNATAAGRIRQTFCEWRKPKKSEDFKYTHAFFMC